MSISLQCSAGHDAQLDNVCVCVLQLSTYVAWWTADIFGRRTLFLQAGFQMSAALIVVAVSLKCLGEQGVWMAWYILAIICASFPKYLADGHHTEM